MAPRAHRNTDAASGGDGQAEMAALLKLKRPKRRFTPTFARMPFGSFRAQQTSGATPYSPDPLPVVLQQRPLEGRGGSAAPLLYYGRKTQLTKERIKHLQMHLQQYGGR